MDICLDSLVPYGPRLILSVSGLTLTADDRNILEQVQPAGITLFSENVDNREQLTALLAEIRDVVHDIQFLVDFEGGMVNRFRKITGPVPPPCEQPDLHAFGNWSGDFLRELGIDVNLAPVLDLDRGNQGNGLDGRYLGDSPDTIVERAGQYLAGLEEAGCTGCLKHYPGLGPTVPDSHFGLPELAHILAEDEAPFRQLASPRRWIMMAHVKISGHTEISTYSSKLVDRIRSFHTGLIVTDDLSMGALPDQPLADRVARTLDAGVDFALVRLKNPFLS